jgi:AcrR family transcriptional regulator
MSETESLPPKGVAFGGAPVAPGPRRGPADAACARPYHHGDLSRALVAAGRRILESEGPAALSLRAVAREAGVSPAAPYHHFKDKGELLDAVAKQGWRELGEAIAVRRAATPDPREALTEIGVAYVTFARQNPALYRLMYHAACDQETMPDHAKDEASGWRQVEAALIEAGADPSDERDMQLTQIAAWCNAHGVAEMVGFKEFAPLREALGGEEAFVRALLGHVGIFARKTRPPTA